METEARDTQGIQGHLARVSGLVDRNAAATGRMAEAVTETTRTVDALARVAEELHGLTARFRLG
jgi:methyl-accepting chemotaxis protein